MTSPTTADIHKLSVKIIETVKKHPALYINDVKGIDMKLQDFRQKIWQHVADQLGFDVNWIKLRWKNLKDTYCRIVKIKQKPNISARRKKWIFEDNLSFLKFPFEPDYVQQTYQVTQDYFQLINNDTMTSESLLEQLEDKNEEDYSEYIEQNSLSTELVNVKIENSDYSIVNNEVIVQQIESKYRKIRPKEEVIQIVEAPIYKPVTVTETPIIITNSVVQGTPSKRKRKLTNENEEAEKKITKKDSSSERVKNSLESFFNDLAKTVKKLPANYQSDIKFNICKVITEAEIKGKEISKTAKKVKSFEDTLPKLLLIPCHMIDNIKT